MVISSIVMGRLSTGVVTEKSVKMVVCKCMRVSSQSVTLSREIESKVIIHEMGLKELS